MRQRFLLPLLIGMLCVCLTATHLVMASVGSSFQIQIQPGPQCFDGQDNDGDGLIDFPADPDCSSEAGTSEAPEVPVPLTTQPSGGGGGGGGSASTPTLTIKPTTSVSIKGKAYPASKVTLLTDAVIVTTTSADINGGFTFNLNTITAGSYTYAVYALDTALRRSETFSFNVTVTLGATATVSGIVLSPTLEIDKTQVRTGDNLTVVGNAVQNSEVTIQISNGRDSFYKTTANANGAYLYTLDTSTLDTGTYSIKAKTTAAAESSPFSQALSFEIGTTNTAAPKPQASLSEAASKSDMNSDGKINLIDFSIEAYWYKRPNPPVKVDLNHDGVVNLVDLSILAYYWTG